MTPFTDHFAFKTWVWYRLFNFWRRCVSCNYNWWRRGDIYIRSEKMCEECWLETNDQCNQVR